MFNNDFTKRLRSAVDSSLVQSEPWFIPKNALCKVCGISEEYLDQLFEGEVLQKNTDSKKYGKTVLICS